MSDTPRTDEQINGKPCTRFAILAGDSLRDALVTSEFCRQLERELNAANERIKNLESALCTVENIDKVNTYQDLESANERINRLEDCIETAWGIIANVSGGDWTRQKTHWQEAVVRWRDNDFHPIMKELSERKSKEAKP